MCACTKVNETTGNIITSLISTSSLLCAAFFSHFIYSKLAVWAAVHRVPFSLKLHQLYWRQTLLSFWTRSYVINQRMVGCWRCLKIWFLCFSEAPPLTAGNKFGDKTWNNALSRNMRACFGRLTPALQMSRWVSLGQPTHLYINSLWPFWMPKQGGLLSNQSDYRNGRALHKV